MYESNAAYAAYLHFLALSVNLRGGGELLELDPMEECVLNEVAALWAQGVQISVTEAMRRSRSSSAATVHRRLTKLRQKGLIRLVPDPADNRIRTIHPTDTTLAYFANLGECLRQAAQKAQGLPQP